MQFGVISTSSFLTGACNFVDFEKVTRAYRHQIAIEIMLLPKRTNDKSTGYP